MAIEPRVFRGFSQLDNPLVGKIVSYLSPWDLGITALVSKKMLQSVQPNADNVRGPKFMIRLENLNAVW